MGADGVVDFAANPLVGADGANANTTYFNSDVTNPTAAGQLLLAAAASNALNYYFSPGRHSSRWKAPDAARPPPKGRPATEAFTIAGLWLEASEVAATHRRFCRGHDGLKHSAGSWPLDSGAPP